MKIKTTKPNQKKTTTLFRSAEKSLLYAFTEEAIDNTLRKTLVPLMRGKICTVVTFSPTEKTWQLKRSLGLLLDKKLRANLELSAHKLIQATKDKRKLYHDYLGTRVIPLYRNTREISFWLFPADTDKHFPPDILKYFAELLSSALKRIGAFQQVEETTSSRYQLLLDELSEGMLVSDAASRVLYANKAAADILGISREKLIRMRLLELIHPLDRIKVKGYYRLLKKKKVFISERKMQHGKGHYITVQRTARMLPDDRMVSILRDISEQKESEYRRDEFVSIASHELRTPLSTLKIYSELLSKELRILPNADDALVIVDEIKNQINEQTNLIEDLLNLSKIRAGKLMFRMDYVDVNALAEKTVRQMRSLIRGKHRIILKGKVKKLIYGDRNRLHQVIVNLLSNASKYSRSRGQVTLTLTQNNRYIKISVHDLGIGIPKREQKKIFRKFYRVDENNPDGFGIGLFLTKDIVKHHKGTLLVKSKPGEGSTFTVSLPFAKQNKDL